TPDTALQALIITANPPCSQGFFFRQRGFIKEPRICVPRSLYLGKHRARNTPRPKILNLSEGTDRSTTANSGLRLPALQPRQDYTHVGDPGGNGPILQQSDRKQKYVDDNDNTMMRTLEPSAPATATTYRSRRYQPLWIWTMMSQGPTTARICMRILGT